MSGDARAKVPEEWRALFEGRSVVSGDLSFARSSAVGIGEAPRVRRGLRLSARLRR